MFDLKGKRALVTGSTQGIGKAIAQTLSAQGAAVIIHGATGAEKCIRAAADMQGPTETAVVDLSRPGAAKELYQRTGDVDILVLNASIQFRRHWEAITDEEFDIQVNCNFRASLMLMQQYEPAMKAKHWGRILMIGSVQQYRPHPDMAVYAAAKCAQMSLVCNLAKQLAPFGITVNNLAPGVIATPRNDAALSDAAYQQKIIDGIPAGFVGKGADCAGAALLLCSEEGRYITGADLPVDGGMHL